LAQSSAKGTDIKEFMLEENNVDQLFNNLIKIFSYLHGKAKFDRRSSIHVYIILSRHNIKTNSVEFFGLANFSMQCFLETIVSSEFFQLILK
jgi:hypothetical protein